MGILSSLFAKKKAPPGVASEISALFEEIAGLLGDEKQQNSMNHEMVRDQITGGRMDGSQGQGVPSEVLENAQGTVVSDDKHTAVERFAIFILMHSIVGLPASVK